MGDPRQFVNCISYLLKCIEYNTEKTQIYVNRFIQDRQIGETNAPAPFDWTMVDVLLSQLSHLAGQNGIFTSEMKDSVIFSLFPIFCEIHFLQDLVSKILTLSIGEQISTVRQRMQSLSQAPLSKVTLLSNMLIEIQDKYEIELSQENKNEEIQSE